MNRRIFLKHPTTTILAPSIFKLTGAQAASPLRLLSSLPTLGRIGWLDGRKTSWVVPKRAIATAKWVRSSVG